MKGEATSGKQLRDDMITFLIVWRPSSSGPIQVLRTCFLVVFSKVVAVGTVRKKGQKSHKEIP